MSIIAIDCGASFIKGALIEPDGTIVSSTERHSPLVNTDDIFKPVQIELLVPLVREMIGNLSTGKTSIDLCISNEMHGFILAYQDGIPFTDYISWQKEMGKIQVNECTGVECLTNMNISKHLLESGMNLRAGLPISNLMYLSEVGALMQATETLFFYTLGDYLIKRLSNLEPICHPTNGAATGLYNILENKWNEELIKSCGAKHIVFPVIGETALEFELDNLHIKALPAIGDQQAALLGAGLADTNTLSFNLGTGAQVSRLVEQAEFSTNYQIRPYFNNMYLKTLPHLPSGRSINVYFRFIKDIFSTFNITVDDSDIWKQLIKADYGVNEKLEMICDMSFFENPLTETQMGSIEKIGEYDLTLDNLMYSVLNQLGNNFIIAANIIDSEQTSTTLLFSGGIANKIEAIRTKIINNYKESVTVEIASAETMIGLYLYYKQRSGT